MSRYNKLISDVLSGRKDGNINFAEIRALLERLGFSLRVKGDHFIFYRRDVTEIINIQPVGAKAKPYQVKQVREILIKYKLGVGENE